MNHKIKVMNTKPVITDEEISRLMDFNGLVQQAASMPYWAKTVGNFKVIMGSLVIVSGSVFLFWISQDDSATLAEPSTTSGQPNLSLPQATTPDSVISLKVMPEQELPSVKVKPKPSGVALQKKEANEEKTKPPTPSTAVYLVYREAEPIEGISHLYQYFGNELKYPEEAVRDSIEGLVTVTFLISSRGQIEQITLLNSLSPAIDAEALRLIRNMPAWKPATIDGKPVPSKFSLPLTFQLERHKP